MVIRQQRQIKMPHLLRECLSPSMQAAFSDIAGEWEEVHLRLGRGCSVTVSGENRRVPLRLSEQDMQQLLMRLCGGSLYAFHESIVKGYLCPGDGVRVGVCGRATPDDTGRGVLGLQAVDTLCIRFPHRLLGVGEGIFEQLPVYFPRGMLFYSPPGVGKTTLLRAIARHFSSGERPLRVAVVDSRCELDDGAFGDELCLSLLSGYPKGLGIEIAARSMNAQLIVCDEIGCDEEARGVLSAANSGVPVIASAHAADVAGLLQRPALRALHEAAVFGAYVGICRREGRLDYLYDVHSWERVQELLCG